MMIVQHPNGKIDLLKIKWFVSHIQCIIYTFFFFIWIIDQSNHLVQLTSKACNVMYKQVVIAPTYNWSLQQEALGRQRTVFIGI